MYNWLILAVCLLAAAVNSQKCYDPLNNGALGTDYFVQQNYFPSPYACVLSSTNVALAEPSTYTFTVGASDGPSCGEIVSTAGNNIVFLTLLFLVLKNLQRYHLAIMNAKWFLLEFLAL